MTGSTPISIEPLAVGAKEAAAILGISYAGFNRAKAEGALNTAIVVLPGTKQPRYSVERLRALINTLADSN